MGIRYFVFFDRQLGYWGDGGIWTQFGFGGVGHGWSLSTPSGALMPTVGITRPDLGRVMPIGGKRSRSDKYGGLGEMWLNTRISGTQDRRPAV
jgi:hypothetical protein